MIRVENGTLKAGQTVEDQNGKRYEVKQFKYSLGLVNEEGVRWAMSETLKVRIK